MLVFEGEVDAKQIKISAANPRLGYAIPEVIEAAGLDELFSKAFEVSGKLYYQMSQVGAKDAIYALLLGHNARWKFEVDAAALSKVLKTSKNRELLNFLGLLRDKIAEHHPHVARILTDNQPAGDHKAHKRHR